MSTDDNESTNPHTDPSTIRKRPASGAFKGNLARLVLAATTVTVLCQSLTAVTNLIQLWIS